MLSSVRVRLGDLLPGGSLYATCAVYLVLVSLAELVTTYVSQLAGVTMHICIMFLLFLYATIESRRYASYLYIALTLAPLIRILSFVIPIIKFSHDFWFILIAIPLFIAVFTIMWLQGLHPAKIGLRMPALHHMPFEACVVLLGFPFGLIEYLILKPRPLISSLELHDLVVVSLILIVCTGFLEEIVFRGMIQYNIMQVMMKWHGIVFVSILFGILHIGNLSVIDCLLAFSAGFVFSIVRDKTGSIYAISLAHGIINIMLFLVAPFYF